MSSDDLSRAVAEVQGILRSVERAGQLSRLKKWHLRLGREIRQMVKQQFKACADTGKLSFVWQRFDQWMIALVHSQEGGLTCAYPFGHYCGSRGSRHFSRPNMDSRVQPAVIILRGPTLIKSVGEFLQGEPESDRSGVPADRYWQRLISSTRTERKTLLKSLHSLYGEKGHHPYRSILGAARIDALLKRSEIPGQVRRKQKGA